MTVTRIFYTTRDLGRLHIADEHSRYGGSVNVYNNFITKFFAQLLGIGFKININQKNYIVNRQSYEKFLIKQGIKVSPTPQLYQDFNQVMLQAQESWRKNPYMRQKLSYQKSFRLFKKMVVAMRSSNIERTQRLANKGANLDEKFWERNHGYGLSFNSNPKQDIRTYRFNFTATHFSPILWAAKNNNTNLVNFYKQLGANTNLEGVTSKFRQHISDVRHGVRYNMFSGRYHRTTYVKTKQQSKPLYKHQLDKNLNYVSIRVNS